ncbi:MAG: hypothetical protein RSB82_02525 [Victivallaceae bacterium]
MMLNYESDIKTLLSLSDSKCYSRILDFKYHPVLKVHELAYALYLSYLSDEDFRLEDRTVFNKTEQGTILLFERACFLWGGLPYLAEYAELGLILLRLSQRDEKYLSVIQNMIAYQQAVFDHRGVVFPTLYRQGIGRNLKEITNICRLFMERFGVETRTDYRFSDKELGFWMTRSSDFSSYVCASGCKSGMGAFLKGDIGIIGFGTQSTPPEDTSGFGIAGFSGDFVTEDVDENEFMENGTLFKVSYHFSAASPSDKPSGFRFLRDSALPGERFYCQTNVSPKSYQVFLGRKELQPKDSYGISVFCIGRSCRIEGGPSLRANSLDSYKGPMKPVILTGDSGDMVVGCSGTEVMEIFSLQGNDSFWGADFIIVFKDLKGPFNIFFQNEK